MSEGTFSDVAAQLSSQSSAVLTVRSHSYKGHISSFLQKETFVFTQRRSLIPEYIVYLYLFNSGDQFFPLKTHFFSFFG